MATTENTLNGNGTAGPFTYTFPAIAASDVYVSVAGFLKTVDVDYTLDFTNKQITFLNTPYPTISDEIRIYRQTADDNLVAEFYPGAAIRAVDLNNDFTQSLYVAQETKRDAEAATAEVTQGVADAALALSNSQTAITTANNAETTANTANATANSANATAATATTTATNATSTANAALNAANQAVTIADSASSTAASAQTAATNAVNTADTAEATANQALDLVSAVVDYDIISNVAAIPGSPADGDGVELLDSTGIQSFSPLTGVPAGFIGSGDLRVKIRYNATGSTWEWVSYVAADPETRYVNSTNGVISNSLGIGTSSILSRLHISGTGQLTANLTDAGDRGDMLRLSGIGGDAGRGGAILFANNQSDAAGSVGYAAIKGLLTDGSNNTKGDIAFSTRNATTDSALTERARITADGRLLVGTTSANQVPTGEGVNRQPYLQVGSNTYAASALSSILYAPDAIGGGSISLARSNTSTIGDQAIANSGDVAGSVFFSASDGAKQVLCAQITAQVNGTPGANDMPGKLVFSTTADGANSPTERMRINADGSTVFSYPVTIPAGSTINGYQRNFNHISASSPTTLTDHTWVSVLAAGLTITLPASATDGMAVRISVGDFTNTVINGNGLRIMDDPSNLTIDRANVTVTLIYDAYAAGPVPPYGWRII